MFLKIVSRTIITGLLLIPLLLFTSLTLLPYDTNLTITFLKIASTDKQLEKIVTQAITDIIPLSFSAAFGILGTFLKLKVSNLIMGIGENRTENKQIASLEIGAIIGIISYFILSSKVIIKILYPDGGSNTLDAGVTFHGIAIAAIISGYFSLEIIGASEAIVNSKIENIVKKQMINNRSEPQTIDEKQDTNTPQ